MPDPTERRRRWLRRLALTLRVAVGFLTLGVFLVAGAVAARALGEDSPLVWTISLVVGLGIGLFVIGKPTVHGLADRIERAADPDGRRPGDNEPPPGGA
jgi:hypothetical protein